MSKMSRVKFSKINTNKLQKQSYPTPNAADELQKPSTRKNNLQPFPQVKEISNTTHKSNKKTDNDLSLHSVPHQIVAHRTNHTIPAIRSKHCSYSLAVIVGKSTRQVGSKQSLRRRRFFFTYYAIVTILKSYTSGLFLVVLKFWWILNWLIELTLKINRKERKASEGKVKWLFCMKPVIITFRQSRQVSRQS